MDGADASPNNFFQENTAVDMAMGRLCIFNPTFAFFQLSPYTIKLWNILHKTYESERPVYQSGYRSVCLLTGRPQDEKHV